MKTPLLIGVSALALLTISATLFAQTTTGTSVIAEMKAAARTFTLTADLNAGAAGYSSAPVTGKKTGDILTAGEYNRLLELAAQGGGGGGGGAGFEVNDTTTKTRYGIIWNGLSWANTPKAMGNLLVDNNATALDCGVYFSGVHQNCKMLETAAHDFCHIVFTGGPGHHSELNYIGGKRWRLINAAFNGLTGGTIVECYNNAGGGTGGGSGFNWDMCTTEWVGTPTNGTPYTNTAGLKCKYTGTGPGVPGVNYYYLCCPAGGGGTTTPPATVTPSPAAPILRWTYLRRFDKMAPSHPGATCPSNAALPGNTCTSQTATCFRDCNKNDAVAKNGNGNWEYNCSEYVCAYSPS